MSFEQCLPPEDCELAVRNPQLSIETFSQLRDDQYAYWSQFARDNPHTLIRAETELSMLTQGRVEQSYVSMLWSQDRKPDPGPEHQERHRQRQLGAVAATFLLRTALENTLFDKSLDMSAVAKTIDMYDDRDGIPHDARLHVPKAIATRILGRPAAQTTEGVQWYRSPTIWVRHAYPARPTPQQLRVLRAKNHIVDPAGLVTLTPYLRAAS